jgi:hypothetical protein
VDGIRQIVEGQPTFAPGDPSLVFLRTAVQTVGDGPSSAFALVDAAQGEYRVVRDGDAKRRLRSAGNIGALVPRLGPAAPLASEVLSGRTVEEAREEIAAAWARFHAS